MLKKTFFLKIFKFWANIKHLLCVLRAWWGYEKCSPGFGQFTKSKINNSKHVQYVWKLNQNLSKSPKIRKFSRITKFSFAGSGCKNYFSSSKIKFSKTLKTLEQIWYLGHYHSPKTQKIRGGSEGGWKLTFWTICCYVQ